MLVKYLLALILIFFGPFSCDNLNKRNHEGINYSELYNIVFKEVSYLLKDCAKSNTINISSVSVSDSLYILEKLDTLLVGDKNYTYTPLIKNGDSFKGMSNKERERDTFFDSNIQMDKYNWDFPLLKQANYTSLQFNKKIEFESGVNNILISFSPPFKQSKTLLVLAKVYSNDIFFIDNFFIFIEIMRNGANEYYINKIFDSSNGC